jgi:hypothetical protein
VGDLLNDRGLMCLRFWIYCNEITNSAGLCCNHGITKITVMPGYWITKIHCTEKTKEDMRGHRANFIQKKILLL